MNKEIERKEYVCPNCKGIKGFVEINYNEGYCRSELSSYCGCVRVPANPVFRDTCEIKLDKEDTK